MRSKDIVHFFPFGTLRSGNCRTTSHRFQIFSNGTLLLNNLKSPVSELRPGSKRGTSREPQLVMSKSCKIRLREVKRLALYYFTKGVFRNLFANGIPPQGSFSAFSFTMFNI